MKRTKTPEQKCQTQEWLANIKCPQCFKARCTCKPGDKTAKCEDCGCTFDVDWDRVRTMGAA